MIFVCYQFGIDSNTGADPASKVRGVISLIFCSQAHNSFATLREMKHTSQHGCDKRRCTAKRPYIANIVFRIVQNHGE